MNQVIFVGDDCSETSESTSGCSSLVPQAQSSNRSLGGSRYGRSIPSGTSLDSLDRRRPSFNTTTFNSPLRASMRARLGSSPFYSGRTMYGGSSQVCDYARLVETSQSRQASVVRRVGPTVRPPPSQQSSLPLSSTAKRILDALEQFSTPMIDAKKMPIVGTKRKLSSVMPGMQHRYTELSIPSTPDLLRVKRRERLQQSTLEARQTASQSIPSPAPTSSTSVATEYSIRGEETNRKKHTGKVKKKEKLEEDDPVVEVKLPAAVLAVDNLPKIDIAIPPPPPALTIPKQLQIPSTSRPLLASKFVFSQPMIVTSVVTPVSIPTSTFKFSEPLGDTVKGSSVSAEESNKQSDSASIVTRTSTDEVSGVIFQKTNEGKKKNSFIIDNQAVSESVSTQKTTSAGFSSGKYPVGQWVNDSQDCKYHKESVSVDKTVSTTQKWECSNCKKNNSFSLEVCISCQTNKNSKSLDATKNNIKPSTPSGFGNLYKKPTGTWECSTCLIQNKGEAVKCVACETQKPAPKIETAKRNSLSVEKPVTIAKDTAETKLPKSDFGDMFKKPSGSWTCEVCMINNNADKVKCASCEAPKPGTKVVAVTDSSTASSVINQPGKGFENFLKKAPGSWTCEVCMINNDADKVKCAACETPKPGATATKTTESSGPKFSFGIPSASTSSTGAGATFTFGIPKGDQTVLTSNTSLSVPTSKLSSDSVQTPTTTYMFGIPKPITPESKSSNAITSSTSSKPTSQIGSSTVQQTNLSFPSTSTTSSVFGSMTNKSKQPETDGLQSVTEKPPLGSSTCTNIKPATPVFGMSSVKSSGANTAPSLFEFGSNKVTQSENKKPTDVKQAQPTFIFGAKQEGYGSGIPSSTTNTMSSSSPSNVLKFGETKTVSSGSGATSISSVSTQASVMTPKPVFNFGSGSEKKITFGTIPGKETSTTTAVSTLGTENKPTFGSFGATTNNTSSTFGSTNAFGSSAFASKEQQPSPFVPQTTTNVFGATTTSTSTCTFSAFGQTNTFQAPLQENKPTPVYAFGSSAPQKESASGGFVFNPVGFQPSQTNQNAGQLLGFNNTPTTASTPSTNFGFEPKLFGSHTPSISPFNTSANAPNPVFGAPAPQQASTFGEQSAPAPVFNFGSQSTQQPQNQANPVFEFGSNQQQNVVAAPTPTPTYMFGAAPAAPAAVNPPAFDPNMKPTFNFTQGAASPVFSAIPTVNSAGPPTQPQNRKILKGHRRTKIPSVRK